MGIDKDCVNGADTHQSKNSKKKKRCSINTTLTTTNTPVVNSNVLNINGENKKSKKIVKTNVKKDSEELSSESKRTTRSKNGKGNCNLNCAEKCTSKTKGVFDQAKGEESSVSLKIKNNNLIDVDASCTKTQCIVQEQGVTIKKNKKQNKAKKGSCIENELEDSLSVDIEGPVNKIRNVKKQVKLSGEHSEQSTETKKQEDLLQNSDDKESKTQVKSEYKRLSKSKRRRIRKKRVLAALGLTGGTQAKAAKPRKKKSNKSFTCNQNVEETCVISEPVVVEGLSEVVDSKLETNHITENLDKVYDRVEFISAPPSNTECLSEQVEEILVEGDLNESKVEDILLNDQTHSLHNLKEENSLLNGSLCCDTCDLVKASSSHTVKNCTKNIESEVTDSTCLSVPSINNGTEEPTILQPRREEIISDKVNIPNFLSHDNVEGLFRSALLNDITLSSRCSEKEVKNFFNTYGTFSEKNRTQFAEVEKLLLSNNKLEESAAISLFECEKSNEVQEKDSFDVQNSCLPSSAPASSSTTDKLTSDSFETIVRQTENEECARGNSFMYSTCSSNVGLNCTETITLNKGSCWGPIYTSPNPENKVISSINSSQIQRENKVSLSSLSSGINSSLSRPEKSESRLLEIVENVLLVHERVREQLTSEKKHMPQRYCSNLSGTGLFSSSESKDFQERSLPPISNRNSVANSSLKHHKSDFECTEQDTEASLFRFDHASNVVRVRPLHECISTSLLSDGIVTENNSVEIDKTELSASKMEKQEKSKEEVKAEREAKKMAKLARKLKATSQDSSADGVDSDKVAHPKTNDSRALEVMAEENSAVSSRSKRTDTKEGKQKKDETTTKVSNNASLSVPAGNVQDSEVTVVEQQVTKSKAELKAERRAKQEAQRAAKAQQQVQQQSKLVKSHTLKTGNNLPSEDMPTKPIIMKPKPQELGKEVSKSVVLHKVRLFNHLYVKQEASVPKSIFATSHLHPAIVRLGVQYATKVIVGSDARCLALLSALRQIIEDYQTPPEKEFSRGLEGILQPSMAFLQECRPLAVSMINAVRHLKWQMRNLSNDISDTVAKRKLHEAIDIYIREQIEVAGQAICNSVIGKISSGDVILTYGCSSLVQQILLKAHKSGTKFRVIVVDARPWREGKEMLRRLVENGLHCSYVVITAISFIMREATKVIIGAHALLANGYVMSRAGSSQIALVARTHSVPVLVCCETHKFSERAQTDSIVYNELGAPDELVTADTCSKDHPLARWKSINHLTPLNITYDVTPPDLVSAVVTELAILPCTSVPVILRIKPFEIGC